MKCPKCSGILNPFNVWLITRWSNTECKKCHTKLNRKINVQVFLITGLLLAGYYFLLFLPLFLLWFFIVMMVDAYTVRLVEVENKPK